MEQLRALYTREPGLGMLCIFTTELTTVVHVAKNKHTLLLTITISVQNLHSTCVTYGIRSEITVFNCARWLMRRLWSGSRC